jgi:hypothetical protein
MNRHKKSTFIIFIILSIWVLQSCQPSDTDIRQAVKAQLKRYPASTLQDIYKNFFQDEFGPDHSIKDSATAREYFDLELEEMKSSGNHVAEPCGLGKNFYRVPMDLVKDGIINDSSYFRAFLESAAAFKTPGIETWKKDWGRIVAVIERMNPDIPNFERDKKVLTGMLDRGEVSVHHSQFYLDNYNPHYRIIGKKEWEKLEAVGGQRSAVSGK